MVAIRCLALRMVRWFALEHRGLHVRSVKPPMRRSEMNQSPQWGHLPAMNRMVGCFTCGALAGWSAGIGVETIGCVAGIWECGQHPNLR